MAPFLEGLFVTRSLAAFAAVYLLCPRVLGDAIPSAPPEEVGLSSTRLARIHQMLRAEIESKRLPGAVALVARRGRVVYFDAIGARDPANGAPMGKDAIFRLFSMTKPLVAVAAMMLMEDGRILLTDPVSKYLPGFARMQVSVVKTDPATGKATYELVPAEQEMTVHDLLRHTSGLAYAWFTLNDAVKEAYTKAGIFQADSPHVYRDLSPAEEVERLSKAPLAHQPGRVWEYGFSADILGRVIEVVSGQRLGEFLDARLFKPLQMVDTGFVVPKERVARLAQPFATDPATGKPVKLLDVTAPPKNDAGGVGAASTASDYLRFAQMLLRGGELDGVRLLSRTTVILMTSDHLGTILDASRTPGERLLGTKGYTFGLGFAVRLDDGLAAVPGRAGEFTWAGASGTYFWIDPQEELIGILMTQAGGARVYYRKLFRQLVYAAIAD